MKLYQIETAWLHIDHIKLEGQPAGDGNLGSLIKAGWTVACILPVNKYASRVVLRRRRWFWQAER